MPRSFLLINANVVRPPVSPIGLEYIGEYLVSSGVDVAILDLSWEARWQSAISRAIERERPLAVGIGFRNLDDCSSASQTTFLAWLKQLVSAVKSRTESPVVLGGVGFSIAPKAILQETRADFGIVGDGEEAIAALLLCLRQAGDYARVPNLLFWHGQEVRCTARADVDVSCLPTPRRRLFDNPRYQAEGGMVGVETKRGCPEKCIYCVDPLTKGDRLRFRSPQSVVSEIQNLTDQRVYWFHICDSEFNISPDHAKRVCRALIDAGLGSRIHWYAYCAPLPFDEELARLMVTSGCAGLNFGVDSLCDAMLEQLGRRHRVSDIEGLVGILRRAGINFIFDLLLGGIGETEETLRISQEESRRLEIPLIGVAEGIRIYPGTALWRRLSSAGQIESTVSDLLDPRFYFSPALGKNPINCIRDIIGDDSRYLLLDRDGQERNYNYVGDSRLCRAIAEGARGAYWDIIQRSRIE
ncbi:MAG: cobalamin-dependent protein [Deltaproteobacteria bacterium]|nr:cobalamin-dependent protein [Deltaproteobacteria bacterium]